MRHLLLFAIRCYWWLVPPRRRRRCIFATSCSKHVFDTTERLGLTPGLKALADRYRKCRPGARLLATRDEDGTALIAVADGCVLRADQLAEDFVRSVG